VAVEFGRNLQLVEGPERNRHGDRLGDRNGGLAGDVFMREFIAVSRHAVSAIGLASLRCCI
jgi:hypothetical protein